MKNIFKFSKLTKWKGNVISGPMAPMEAGKVMAKEFGLKISSIYRLHNTQAYNHTYDHLVNVTRTYNGHVYFIMYVDMGANQLPVAVKVDDEIVITPIYKYHISPEQRKYHLEDMEASKRSSENPIMELDHDEFERLFKELEEIVRDDHSFNT